MNFGGKTAPSCARGDPPLPDTDGDRKWKHLQMRSIIENAPRRYGGHFNEGFRRKHKHEYFLYKAPPKPDKLKSTS